MRAVHINPLTQQVCEVQLSDDNPIRSVIELMGGSANSPVFLRAAVFNENNGDTLYADANVSDPAQYWAYLGQPLSGQGVIVGRNFAEDAEVPLTRATDHTVFLPLVGAEDAVVLKTLM